MKNLGFFNEIPLDQAKELFSELMGYYDRLTIKAYFGTISHRSTRKFLRRAQYQSGTVSLKTIELSQQVSGSKGYLEKMGLATFHLRGSIWFMKIEQEVLVPQLAKVDSSTNSMQNISLSPNSQSDNNVQQKDSEEGKHCDESFEMETPERILTEQPKNNNSQDERDKSYNIDINIPRSDNGTSRPKLMFSHTVAPAKSDREG